MGNIFASLPEVEWISTLYPTCVDDQGEVFRCYYLDGFSRDGFQKGENYPGKHWHFKGYIQQESTFWRRSLWKRAGARVDNTLQYAGDFELWARFYQHAELYGVPSPLAAFRMHQNQKTAQHLDLYMKEAEVIFKNYGGELPERVESAYRRIVSCVPRLVNCNIENGSTSQTHAPKPMVQCKAKRHVATRLIAFEHYQFICYSPLVRKVGLKLGVVGLLQKRCEREGPQGQWHVLEI